MFAGTVSVISILTACGTLLLCNPASAHWPAGNRDRDGDRGVDRQGYSGWGTRDTVDNRRGYSGWGHGHSHDHRSSWRDNGRRFGSDRFRHGGRPGQDDESGVDRRRDRDRERPVDVAVEAPDPEESQPVVVGPTSSVNPAVSTIPIASSGNPGSTNLIVVNVNSSPRQTPAATVPIG